MSEWTENEEGPDCVCGGPTMVKLTPEGPVLVCLFHTAAEGVYSRLPPEKPADWMVEWPESS